MSRSQCISIAGMDFIPDLSGALYVPDFQALLIADLHLEKGTSLARRGVHLPPYDTRESLRQLSRAIQSTMPRRLIFLGDSFHDSGARERIDTDDLTALKAITSDIETSWITGNHDPHPPNDIGGRIASEINLGPVVLRHEPQALPCGAFEIAGHLHPAAAVESRGRHIRCRCFIADDRRMILPAFGSYTGALSVKSEAFSKLFGDYQVWMIGTRSIHRIPASRIK